MKAVCCNIASGIQDLGTDKNLVFLLPIKDNAPLFQESIMPGFTITYAKSFILNFMGKAPAPYKTFILFCLFLNPVVAHFSPFVAGWLLVIEFIFTLAMSLDSYPLQSGGLLVIEACAIGLCDMHEVTEEISGNLEVLLLLMFMVAGIHFIRDFLLFIFTKLLVHVRSGLLLSFLFCFISGLLSAFVDALTVLAIIIAVATGLYTLFIKTVSSDKRALISSADDIVPSEHQKELSDFRAFLRSLLMSAAIGTTLGGVCTIVGEPQNLIIGNACGWDFGTYALRMSPISLPIVIAGLITCLVCEKFKLFGYGASMPDAIYQMIKEKDEHNSRNLSRRDKLNLIIQFACFLWLVFALGLHLASVGLIGLSVVIFATALCGISSEGEIGEAFTESMPFCSLLCVFFAVVTIISNLGLFTPIIDWVLSVPAESQSPIFFLANGIISAVSDNVFVATIYIEQVHQALVNNIITPEQYDELAIAINAGTNLASVATPNGQAAFLFLLTSPIAVLIKMPYFRMMWMSLPYFIVFTVVGIIGVWFILPYATNMFLDLGLIEPAVKVAANL